MSDTIIISLDFGTTFSGAAWAITKRPDEIHVITDWDSEYNTCSDRGKCPTHLEYGTVDHETPWGYNIPPHKDILRWFKLLLLEENDVADELAQSAQFKQAITLQSRLKKSPVELVSCFLRSLWEHCINSITGVLGSNEVDSCKISFIMTVPAMWPHYVQARMRTAADQAGMLRLRTTDAGTYTPALHFVSEPEAAALAVLAEMHPRPDIKQNDTIIICDAGGGTADLISYQVGDVNTFQLRECVAGEGGLCGGIFVDHNFENLIASKLGTSSWKKLETADKRKFMKENWEYGIKSQFSGNARCFYAEVPDGYLADSAMGKRKKFQTISLEKDDLLAVFSPVVDKICGLVARQEAAIEDKDLPSPKFIILVGGFGCCRYLRNRLTEAYPNSTVLNPTANQSWTAVCRGAVRHAIVHKSVASNGPRNAISRTGKQGSFFIQSRICRMSYGFRYHIKWDPKVHEEQDKMYSGLEEEYRADNQMNWFLKQGQSLESLSHSSHDYYRIIPAGSNATIEEDLHVCTSTDLPARQTEEVRTLCVIKWDQKVNLSKLKKRYNSAREAYYMVEYKIRVAVDGPELKITIFHQGKKVAHGEVKVEFK